jgi:hypothetical protein
MDPSFQPGEIITAHIPDLIVDRVQYHDDEPAWVHVAYRNEVVTADFALPLGTGIRFERVTPADGEPQPGEIWADQIGELYFACTRNGKVMLVSLEPSPSYHLNWEDMHRGPTGPIYRVAQRPQIEWIEAGS